MSKATANVHNVRVRKDGSATFSGGYESGSFQCLIVFDVFSEMHGISSPEQTEEIMQICKREREAIEAALTNALGAGRNSPILQVSDFSKLRN